MKTSAEKGARQFVGRHRAWLMAWIDNLMRESESERGIQHAENAFIKTALFAIDGPATWDCTHSPVHINSQ